MTGKELMEKALQIRDAYGVSVAAEWMEGQGIPYQLAMLALRGR